MRDLRFHLVDLDNWFFICSCIYPSISIYWVTAMHHALENCRGSSISPVSVSGFPFCSLFAMWLWHFLHEKSIFSPLGWAWLPDLLWSMGILACIMQSGSKKNVLDHWGLPFLVAHENPVTITRWMSPGFPAWWEQCIDHLFSANTWMNPADTTMRKEKQSQQRASQIADSQNHKHTKKWLLF